MKDEELRKISIEMALNINSPCEKPYDRVSDLLRHADLIVSYLLRSA